jgi:formate dehydrogenase
MVAVCDVVTINAPLHPETENLFDEKMIGRMKRGAYLVCNRDAIVRALETGRLAGYAGDVWTRSQRRGTTPGEPCRITA